MVWFKVDDSFAFHPKALQLTPSAGWLWVRAGAWSAQQLTNGRIPAGMVVAMGATVADAEELVAATLWKPDADGWVFHDWADYQPSRAQVESDRAAARERQQRGREAARARREADSHTVTHTVTHAVTDGEVTAKSRRESRVSRPDPTRPVLPNGSTQEHARASPRFNEFWDLYPKREGKAGAKKKWDTVTRTVDADLIMAGLRRYVDDIRRRRTDRQFVKGPEVWLNKGCWEDDFSAGSPSAGEASGWQLPDPPDGIEPGSAEWRRWAKAERDKHFGRAS